MDEINTVGPISTTYDVNILNDILINKIPDLNVQNLEPSAAEFVRNASIEFMSSNFMEGKDPKVIIKQCINNAKLLYIELYKQGFFINTYKKENPNTKNIEQMEKNCKYPFGMKI